MAQRNPYGEPTSAPRSGESMIPERLTGYKLYSSDDKSIGKVADEGAGYLTIPTGLFGLGGELHVPRSAISSCSDDRCYLNVPSDRIHEMGWQNPPAEQTGATRQAGMAGAPEAHRVSEEETRRIPLREEEIEVHKHREKVGEVVISKNVVEEKQTIDVPIQHEEVCIERHTVDRPTSEALPAPGPEGEVARVPIYEDVVDVEKHARVHEEIVVSPEDVTTQERVTRTVRREVPKVEETGEAGKFVHEEGSCEDLSPEECEKLRRQAR
ncbi:MAG TPA: YsnF/AvaK domain-containing protein [Chloroflexota bacterium]|nr:YsnF/AvaK domain-containing protein [Chloroflexota bacterium]